MRGARNQTAEETELDAVRDLYLDILKRSLTGALYEDNDSILGGVRTDGSESLKKKVAHGVGRAANRFHLEVAYKKPYDPALREVGMDWPARAESMIGLKRMSNIQDCVQTVIRDNVPGDLIETGVWRGGAVIFMRAILKAFGDSSRTVWCADSFEGLPPPNVALYASDAGDRLHEKGGLAVGVDIVKHNFTRYGLLDEQVKFLVGWFKDTLPTAPIDKLSILRLDGDMYESTWQAIEALYPRLSPGGFCIVDDYVLFPEQAQKAVHDYRSANGITDEIIDIDGSGAYWRKSA
jgi:O-methyltransferase